MIFQAHAHGQVWDVTVPGGQAAITAAVASLLPGQHGPLSVAATVKGYNWHLWMQPVRAAVLPSGAIRIEFNFGMFGTVILEGGFGDWHTVAESQVAVCV